MEPGDDYTLVEFILPKYVIDCFAHACLLFLLVLVYSLCYIYHGEEVYMVNIQPETEVRGSL